MWFCANKSLTQRAPRKIGPMQNINEQGLTDQFFSPANAALTGAKNRREIVRCFRTATGCVWALAGYWGMCAVAGSSYSSGIWRKKRRSAWFTFSRLLRVRAGCAWSAKSTIPSPRRYRNTRIPVFSDYEDFNKFVVYAGDGHYIGASAHEAAIRGKKRPCGSFYTLNLRTRAMTHLSVSDLEGGMKKGRARHARAQTPGRPGPAPGGTQRNESALSAWDPAGIDIEQWGKWKNQYGVYFLSRPKANMGFVEEGSRELGARGSGQCGCDLRQAGDHSDRTRAAALDCLRRPEGR